MLRRASSSTNRPLPFQCLYRFGADARVRQRLVTLRTASSASGPTVSPASDDLTKHLRVQRLIDSYRSWGPGSCGDVKTHLGFEGEHQTLEGEKVDISVIANPSHLESVSPVSQGSTHATQSLAGPDGVDKTLCLALHGDAAFTGQGVVYETLSLAHLSAYDVGGTVRLVVNNQIGFTVDPESSRSTTYCTDFAKAPDTPIFHVNSDSIEELVFICQLAADWRSKFKSDVIVDIVCYRKFGHNEMDQPRFTQPLMYQKIASHASAEEIYTQKLLTQGSFTKEELASRKSAIWNKLNQSFESAKTYTPEIQDPPKAWNGLPGLGQLAVETFPTKSTAITADKIQQIIERITSAPGNFTLHNNLKRILDGRKKQQIRTTLNVPLLRLLL